MSRAAARIALAASAIVVVTDAAAIVLDGRTAHHVFDGVGALSAGGSSRYLYDYPEPQRSDILDLLFKPSTAAALHILKVEIGGDAQSTDGSEASHMHTRADLSCGRGYESWLIAQAKKRNPAILTYGLSWAAPHWVGDGHGNGTGFYSPDNYVYQTKWLECVRSETNTTVDFMGIWNEKPSAPPDYVVGLRAAMDAAGFASTRLSVMDNDYSLNNLVAAAVADPAFAAAFYSVGRHYPCDYPGPAVEQELHKPYWSTEDQSAPNDWTGAACWARLLNQNYVLMNMTATIAWSLVWAVPTGLPCGGSGMMTAQEPWSGHYSGGDGAGGVPSPTPSLDGPLWTSAHTTQFVAPGWRYLHVPGGGSGFLDAAAGNGSYVTLVPPTDLSAFTLIIEKAAGSCKCTPPGVGVTSDGTATFSVAGGLPGAGTALQVWRTNATAQFWRDADIVVASNGTFSVFVPADSIVTLASRANASHGAPSAPIPTPGPFPLPYADDFSSYPEDATPVRFFADQTGSFAARNGSLAQVVTLDPGPNRWVREDVDPLTLIGDASLGNVTVSVGVTFSAAPNASGLGQGAFGFTYAQACARITDYSGLRNGPPNGYCLGVNATGAWLARAGAELLGAGQLPSPFDPSAPHALVLSVAGAGVLGWVLDGPAALAGAAAAALPPSPPLLNATSGAFAAGLVGLGCGYHAAAFDNFTLAPAGA